MFKDIDWDYVVVVGFVSVIIGLVLIGFVGIAQESSRNYETHLNYKNQQSKLAEANKSKAEKLASELKSALKDSGVKIQIIKD